MNTISRIRTTAAALAPFPASKRGRTKKPQTVMNYDSLFTFIPAADTWTH